METDDRFFSELICNEIVLTNLNLLKKQGSVRLVIAKRTLSYVPST